MFTLSNMVSTLTLKKESFVMRKIKEVSVDMKHKSGQMIESFGRNGDRFPVKDLIRFHLRVKEGDVERFIVERNGEVFKETTLDVVPFTATEVSKEGSHCLSIQLPTRRGEGQVDSSFLSFWLITNIETIDRRFEIKD